MSGEDRPGCTQSKSLEHTPGPWTAVQRTWGYPAVEGGPERRLWHVNAPGDYSLAGLTIYSRDEVDARLIAAAPDLLNGCRAVLGLLQLITCRDDISPELQDVLRGNHRIAEALDALEKATGCRPSSGT